MNGVIRKECDWIWEWSETKLNRTVIGSQKPAFCSICTREKHPIHLINSVWIWSWKFVYGPGKVMEKSWNFIDPEVWEPCLTTLEVHTTNIADLILYRHGCDRLFGDTSSVERSVLLNYWLMWYIMSGNWDACVAM